MGRAAKIASVAALGGVLMALAILHLSSPPAPDASSLNRIAADARPVTSTVSERCRTATVADTECAAAWEAKRRHFFGQKD
ncbi:MAG TPA: putative entry exclusion protein TrbK-alt [Sphingopyxis sp.]|uniref:putative entry exclusion protein TrbK-alt n=1 Tax=Sphingopyxis sp. TaxID=1908224 RepID=UPI002E30393B|nr:putative entry exclusion protein TrbK-alt [Sphingopyxis sp.]HEX2814441.1 putative entry exclusion protein TrbK-alt [Sphingopyxis sp.]